MAFRVLKYGVKIKTLEEDIADVFKKQISLWNNLVDEFHSSRERYDEACATHIPEYKEARDNVIKIKEDMQFLYRDLEDEDFEEDKAAIKKEIEEKGKTLSAFYKEMSLASKQLDKAVIKELNSKHNDVIRECRQKSGLHWGNYNEICARYQDAKIAALKKGGRLYHQSFNGSGTLNCDIVKVPKKEDGSIVKDNDKPVKVARTVEDLLSGKLTHVKLENLRVIKSKKYLDLKIVAYTYRDEKNKKQYRFIEGVVHYHTDLPKDAEVVKVRLKRCLTGKFKYNWRLYVMVNLPDLDSVKHNGALTAKLGVDVMQKYLGSEIARLCDSEKNNQSYFLPSEVIHKLKIANTYNDNANISRTKMTKWLSDFIKSDGYKYSDKWVGLARHVSRKRACESTHKELLNQWRIEYPLDDKRVFDRYEAWLTDYMEAKHKYLTTYGRAVNWRKEIYRKYAKDIMEKYHTVEVYVVDSSEYTKDGNKAYIYAALYDFVKMLELQAQNTGTNLIIKKLARKDIEEHRDVFSLEFH